MIIPARLEQVWFPGAHGDVGGQLGGYEVPRGHLPTYPAGVDVGAGAAECGLSFARRLASWRYETDPLAPARGTWRGHGRFLMTRKRRKIGRDRSERLHDSVELRAAARAQGQLVAGQEG